MLVEGEANDAPDTQTEVTTGAEETTEETSTETEAELTPQQEEALRYDGSRMKSISKTVAIRRSIQGKQRFSISIKRNRVTTDLGTS